MVVPGRSLTLEGRGFKSRCWQTIFSCEISVKCSCTFILIFGISTFGECLLHNYINSSNTVREASGSGCSIRVEQMPCNQEVVAGTGIFSLFYLLVMSHYTSSSRMCNTTLFTMKHVQLGVNKAWFARNVPQKDLFCHNYLSKFDPTEIRLVHSSKRRVRKRALIASKYKRRIKKSISSLK